MAGSRRPTSDVEAVELVDVDAPADALPVSEGELERLRIRAGTARWGAELDDRVLPAEAGLEARAISFTKGCYPGQEPVARLHYRGHPNRTLRVLALDAGEPPPRTTPLVLEGKEVGRVTSSAPDAELGIVALGYVRREVPADAVLSLADGRPVRRCESRVSIRRELWRGRRKRARRDPRGGALGGASRFDPSPETGFAGREASPRRPVRDGGGGGLRGNHGFPHSYAPGTIRTCDLCLRRAALYPLSYGRGEGQV